MAEGGSPEVPVPEVPPRDPRDPDWLPPEVNTGVAHPARIYDYLLGGKDNFAIDRAFAEAGIAMMPLARPMARVNRAFLGRAVRYLAAEAGVRQFLDIGTGIPAAGNTHEVAQAIAPDSRVAYVDNDPIVAAHARALMTSTPAGATTFIQADLREPGRILADPALHAILDLGKPVALMLVAILPFFTDSDDPQGIVSELVSALPPGSYLTISHTTADYRPEEVNGVAAASQSNGIVFTPRSRDEVAAFFAGLDLVDPGIVPAQDWHPDDAAQQGLPAYLYAAMGRKP